MWPWLISLTGRGGGEEVVERRLPNVGKIPSLRPNSLMPSRPAESTFTSALIT